MSGFVGTVEQWKGALAVMAERVHAQTDADLASWLDIPPSTLSNARRGREELPGHAKYLVLRVAGLVKDDTGNVLSVLPKRAREKVISQLGSIRVSGVSIP